MNYREALRFIREEIDRSPESVMEIFDKLPQSQTFSREQLLKGFKVELEHANTVGGNPETIARIVLDHLSEHPTYYDKLLAAGL